MFDFESEGLIIPPGTHASDNIKIKCPHCSSERKNKSDRSLSVNLIDGLYNCHHCGFTGKAKELSNTDNSSSHTPPAQMVKKEYTKPSRSDAFGLSDKVTEWFKGRGISEETLRVFRVSDWCDAYGNSAGVQFNYFQNGEWTNYKRRSYEKKFYGCSGAESTPYNIDAVKDSEEVIITEGEIDCMSFYEVGITYAISVPSGAKTNPSKYLDKFWDTHFANKKVVYIASDTDEAGIELRDNLIEKFGKDKCRVLTYGEGIKDANECLTKCGRDALTQAYKACEIKRPESIITLPDYEKELDDILDHGLHRGMILNHEWFDKKISFETKRLCIVTGIPSSGKSEFIDEMCVRFNIFHDLKIGYFSPENMPTQLHAIKIIEKLTGKTFAKECPDFRFKLDPAEYIEVKNYYRDNFFHVAPNGASTLEAVLDGMEYLVDKCGVKIVVIDPYNRLESEQGEKETETQYISKVLDRLTTFAQTKDVLVILMAHPTKIKKDNGNGGVPTFYDIAGSANFYNKADFGLIVHRDMNTKTTLVRIEKVKFRHLGEKGDTWFKFNAHNGRYINVEENMDGEYEDGVGNLVTKKNRGEIPDLKLRVLEEDRGPIPVSEIIKKNSIKVNIIAEEYADLTEEVGPLPF